MSAEKILTRNYKSRNQHSASKVSLECICYAEATTDTAALALQHLLLESPTKSNSSTTLHSLLHIVIVIMNRLTLCEVSSTCICHAEALPDTAALAPNQLLPESPTKANLLDAFHSLLCVLIPDTCTRNHLTLCEVSFACICHAEAFSDTAALVPQHLLPEHLTKMNISADHLLPYTPDTFIRNHLTLCEVSPECICLVEAHSGTALAVHSPFAESPNQFLYEDDKLLRPPFTNQHISSSPKTLQVRVDKQTLTSEMTESVSDSELSKVERHNSHVERHSCEGYKTLKKTKLG